MKTYTCSICGYGLLTDMDLRREFFGIVLGPPDWRWRLDRDVDPVEPYECKDTYECLRRRKDRVGGSMAHGNA